MWSEFPTSWSNFVATNCGTSLNNIPFLTKLQKQISVKLVARALAARTVLREVNRALIVNQIVIRFISSLIITYKNLVTVDSQTLPNISVSMKVLYYCCSTYIITIVISDRCVTED